MTGVNRRSFEGLQEETQCTNTRVSVTKYVEAITAAPGRLPTNMRLLLYAQQIIDFKTRQPDSPKAACGIEYGDV